MQLAPWRAPSNTFLTLQQEMNRIFENFLPPTRSYEVVPAIDVNEDDGTITVSAELPGVKRDDVTISVRGDILEIKGEKREEKRHEGANVHALERTYGSFMRRLVLPCEVEGDQAEAKMDQGVLHLKLPKKTVEESGAKVIKVN
ncbi:Spore protein SP21 [Enhygromyxa salina]|uniref:Spore protein SP21 n=1 Tax=Enhygromyxa salina TaxID=215803 RepID=A0A2S9XE68_9BACT|nr:Hsp20/alpha crystallin family protein [Enhygromyxa salina]PRP91155.1 Spore protein SP21 [Enhygromyxa salina]